MNAVNKAHNKGNAVPANPAWTDLIPESQVQALREVAEHLHASGVEVLLGGAFALGRHVGRWRGTKDIDFFLRPRDRERAIEALTTTGFSDYFGTQEYDRSWIFRAFRDDALVDVIWTIPNHVTDVDEAWFQHAARFSMHGREYTTIPLEELIWIKLFVLQRDRCDWPDVLNLLRCNARLLDWERLVRRIDRHAALLLGALHVLQWLSPEVLEVVPAWVKQRFHLGEEPGQRDPGEEANRAALLDSRPWYAVCVPEKNLMAP